MTSSTPQIERWRWSVVWLLFLATAINYMDRQALASTQTAVLAEFVPMPADADEFTAKQIEAERNNVYAQINFAFGMSFALFQILAGFMVDRWSLRWLYVMAILLWSAAGVVTGFVPAGAITLLMTCRVVLGIGEAFNWPCAVGCVRRVIPRDSRGLANGIFHSGASIGAVATPLVVLLFVERDGSGWRAVFIVVGTLGLVWAMLWVWITRGAAGRTIDRLEKANADVQEHTPLPYPGSTESIWDVFTFKLFWLGLVSLVCVNICWHFYTQWFPRYLWQELKYDTWQQQWVLAGFFVAAGLGAMLTGWTTRKLTRAGRTVERSRKLVMTGLALIVVLATIPAAFAFAEFPELRFPLFYLVAAAAMGGFPVAFGLLQDVSPPNTALVLGLAGSASWVTISVIGLGVGHVAAAGNYAWLFMAVGCVPAVAAVIGWFWPEPDHGNSSAPSS
jgi:ACS family hexuronate transporter-like MFS transporter